MTLRDSVRSGAEFRARDERSMVIEPSARGCDKRWGLGYEAGGKAADVGFKNKANLQGVEKLSLISKYCGRAPSAPLPA